MNQLDEKSQKLGLKHLKSSVEKGNSYGQCYLGLCHYFGMAGLEQNLDEANRLFNLSAEQKNPLGLKYKHEYFETETPPPSINKSEEEPYLI